MPLRIAALTFVAACTDSSPDGPAGGGGAVDWTSDTVRFTAAFAALEVDSHWFKDASKPIEVEQSHYGSDLDVTWSEAGFTPRVHFDFHQDEAQGTWSFGQVRVYRIDTSDWLRVVGPFYATPLAEHREGPVHRSGRSPSVGRRAASSG